MPDRSKEYPVQNANYESDILYVTQFCRWTLKPIGIWPLVEGRASRTDRLLSGITMVICTFALGFVLIPSVLYVLLQERDVNAKIKLCGPLGFCLTSTVKYFYLGLRGDAFRRCVDHVKEDWRSVRDGSDRETMTRHATIGRNITILCAAFLYSGGISYHTAVPLFSRQRIDENRTFRPLNYPGYDSFLNWQDSPTYEILFVYHCAYAIVTYNITTAACSLAAIFVTHACGQMRMIVTRLEDLVEGRDSEGTSVEDRLATIVKHHVAVLRFSESVEKVLREICLMEIVASTLIICLLQYYCITVNISSTGMVVKEWQHSDVVAITTYFVLLVSFTFNIFIFCYIGELLVQEYSRMGHATYCINWYHLPSTTAVRLVLIIAMSKYPPKLTCGKIIDLSLDTFGKVLKSSIMYLNLLRTVTD